MCFIFNLINFVFRLLDLEDQIISITYCDLDILIYIEKDLGELVSVKRVFVIIIDLYFFSRYILEYNLFSLVKYDAKMLTTKIDISFV